MTFPQMSKPRLLLSGFAALAISALTLASAPVAAQTVTENLAGTNLTGVPGFMGQSFTTPSGGPWQSIRFNFFSDVPAVTPNALGTAYLLSLEYLGTPAALSAVTPGFLAQSTSSAGGIWTFPSALTLQPGTQYFLYGDTNFPANTLSGNNTIPGGQLYFSTGSGNPYAPSGVSFNFRLSGVASPEPGAVALLAPGLLALTGSLRRRRR